MSPVEIIGARPQTSTETSSFTPDSIDAAVEVAALSSTLQSKVFFTNFAVDGVSAESSDVMEAVSKFLDGKTNFVGSVDNNTIPKMIVINLLVDLALEVLVTMLLTLTYCGNLVWEKIYGG